MYYCYSEKSAIKSLKHRYERFLEEDKQRSSRNDNLLRMLERIDYQAATLAAKTEKLKLLKVRGLNIDSITNAKVLFDI